MNTILREAFYFGDGLQNVADNMVDYTEHLFKNYEELGFKNRTKIFAYLHLVVNFFKIYFKEYHK